MSRLEKLGVALIVIAVVIALSTVWVWALVGLAYEVGFAAGWTSAAFALAGWACVIAGIE